MKQTKKAKDGKLERKKEKTKEEEKRIRELKITGNNKLRTRQEKIIEKNWIEINNEWNGMETRSTRLDYSAFRIIF